MATLKALVLRGPNPERDGVSSWTAKDLCRIALDRFGVSYSENGMLDLLHRLGLRLALQPPLSAGYPDRAPSLLVRQNDAAPVPSHQRRISEPDNQVTVCRFGRSPSTVTLDYCA